MLNLFEQKYPIVIATSHEESTFKDLMSNGVVPSVGHYSLIYTCDYNTDYSYEDSSKSHTYIILKKPDLAYFTKLKEAIGNNPELRNLKLIFIDDK